MNRCYALCKCTETLLKTSIDAMWTGLPQRTRLVEVWDKVHGNSVSNIGYPKRSSDCACSDWHDQLHDGLRHDRYRARHCFGQSTSSSPVVECSRSPIDLCPSDLKTLGYDDRFKLQAMEKLRPGKRHHRRCSVVCRDDRSIQSLTVLSSQPRGLAAFGWQAHVQHDGRCSAFPLRSDQQDRQHAQRCRTEGYR